MTRRRHHKSDTAAIAARANRFKALQAELMQASELANTPANRQRVETVALIDLATDSVREAILRGEVVEVGALERLAAARASILPTVSTTLNVRFIDGSDVCVKCRAPLPPKEERLQPPEAAPVEAAPPVKADPAPQRAAAPLSAAPAVPTNVTPLQRPNIHADIHAPLRCDEPWRGHTEGNRRFGFTRFDNNG